MATDAGEMRAEISGRLARGAGAEGYPVAGDRVAAQAGAAGDTAIIHQVLPRRTVFTRKAARPSGGMQVAARHALRSARRPARMRLTSAGNLFP